MSNPRILIQLDSDPQPSVFDAVVAVDSGIDHLLQYGAVEPKKVLPLVHGAMFTRGPDKLKNTAVFIGGSSVTVGETLAQEIKQAFFGPMRVSVMLDGNGSNTTAVAAVLCAARHLQLSDMQAVVLGGTGPVGGRVARLLVRHGARVHLASRNLQRAQEACEQIAEMVPEEVRGNLQAMGMSQAGALPDELAQANVLFGCGAAGVTLLDEQQMAASSQAKVAIDLNAVPPAGLFGIGVTDKAVERDGRLDYGAIGVGGLKMKIHKAAVRSLFEDNQKFLDAEEIFAIGQDIEAQRQ